MERISQENHLGIILFVHALETPRVIKRCPRCAMTRHFVSSDKFRLNAQKRRVDIWLIYHCEICNSSWKFTIEERIDPRRIDKKLYQEFLANDSTLAWKYAFDQKRLVQAKVRAEFRVPYAVKIRFFNPSFTNSVNFTVKIQLDNPLELRLEKLLSQEFGLSRSLLIQFAQSGMISASKKELRRSITSEQQFLFSGEAADHVLRLIKMQSLS